MSSTDIIMRLQEQLKNNNYYQESRRCDTTFSLAGFMSPSTARHKGRL